MIRRNKLSSPVKAWKNHKGILLRSQSGYVLDDPNYVTFWKRQNYGDCENISSSQGHGGGTARWGQVLSGEWNYFSWHSKGRNMSLYICGNPENIQPKSEPSCKPWILINVMCQYWFINYNKWSIQVKKKNVQVGDGNNVGLQLFFFVTENTDQNNYHLLAISFHKRKETFKSRKLEGYKLTKKNSSFQ